MIPDDVHIDACWAPEHSYTVQELYQQWLDFVDFPEEGGETVYPYRVVFNDDTVQTGRAAEQSELERLFERCQHGDLTDVRFGTLRLSISPMGSTEGEPYTPMFDARIRGDRLPALIEEQGRETVVADLVDLAATAHERIAPAYTYVVASYLPWADEEAHPPPNWEGFAHGELGDDPPWAFTLGDDVVEAWGREFIHEAPAYDVRDLADGSVLVVVDGDPFDSEAYGHREVAAYLNDRE